MSLQSALLGYLLSKLIPSVSPLSPQENVVLQTTAVATGTMPLAAGFVGIIPALGLLDPKKDGQDPIILTWMGAVGWSCAVAYFGCVEPDGARRLPAQRVLHRVFLAAPLRKQVVRFPAQILEMCAHWLLGKDNQGAISFPQWDRYRAANIRHAPAAPANDGRKRHSEASGCTRGVQSTRAGRN